MDHMDALFNPETVAVVGASNDLTKWGAGIFSRVLASPSVKRRYPVNNRVSEVQSVKAYPTVGDLPEPVDFVAIVIPYPDVPSVIRDCAARGVKAALIITAGLGETGEEGVRLEREIVTTAHAAGIRLVGPNCMGHFNTANDFSTLRMGMPITRGNIAVISQSGGFAMHILGCGVEAGLGFSKFVSVGNEADLHFEDFLEYFAQDEQTKVITGYIEGLRKGKDFLKLAAETTKTKPIVVVKVGRTGAGAKAAKSHTSAIAGEDLVYDAAFRQTGVIRVDEVEEIFDIAAALLRQPLPKSNRVGILTGGGGFGCVTSDACERMDLDVAPLEQRTIERLNKVLPPRWPHGNPVDTVAAGFVTYPCLWPLMEDKNLDALLIIGSIGFSMRRMRGTTTSSTEADKRMDEMVKLLQDEEMKGAQQLIEYMDEYQKPVIVSSRMPGGFTDSPVLRKLQDNGVMIYPTPERAVKVMAHLVQYSNYLRNS
jgi:acyl-CoA synthetase (NDP forming)